MQYILGAVITCNYCQIKIIHIFPLLLQEVGTFVKCQFPNATWTQDTTAGHILLELAKARIVQCHLQGLVRWGLLRPRPGAAVMCVWVAYRNG